MSTDQSTDQLKQWVYDDSEYLSHHRILFYHRIAVLHDDDMVIELITTSGQKDPHSQSQS